MITFFPVRTVCTRIILGIYVEPEILEVWCGWMACVSQRELNPGLLLWSSEWKKREEWGQRWRSPVRLPLVQRDSLQYCQTETQLIKPTLWRIFNLLYINIILKIFGGLRL